MQKNTIEANTTQLDNSLRIVGVSARIRKEQSSESIGALWQQAASAGLLRDGEPSYCAYTAYEDDLANAFQIVIGTASAEEPRAGLTALVIPGGSYARFASEGNAVETAQRLWRHVWTTWKPTPRRSFDVDFERYDGSIEHARVTLHIGVR